jgi:hypothetical protein
MFKPIALKPGESKTQNISSTVHAGLYLVCPFQLESYDSRHPISTILT